MENGSVDLIKDGTGSINSHMTVAEIEAAPNNVVVTKEYLNVKTIKVTLTSADILSINRDNKYLLVSSGVGKVIRPIRAFYNYRYGTTSYVDVGNDGKIEIGTDSESIFCNSKRGYA